MCAVCQREDCRETAPLRYELSHTGRRGDSIVELAQHQDFAQFDRQAADQLPHMKGVPRLDQTGFGSSSAEGRSAIASVPSASLLAIGTSSIPRLSFIEL
jgi:hypothetical protein